MFDLAIDSKLRGCDSSPLTRWQYRNRLSFKVFGQSGHPLPALKSRFAKADQSTPSDDRYLLA
jgi:hypothetical protein